MEHQQLMQAICRAAYGEEASIPVGDLAYMFDNTVVRVTPGEDGAVYIFDRHGEITNIVTDELPDMPEGMPFIAWCICVLCQHGNTGLRKWLNKPIEVGEDEDALG